MVSVDENTCIGCAACVSICESVFEMKNGKSVVKKGQEKSKDKCVLEAVEICPVNAIKA
jgi:ferredoxin